MAHTLKIEVEYEIQKNLFTQEVHQGAIFPEHTKKDEVLKQLAKILKLMENVKVVHVPHRLDFYVLGPNGNVFEHKNVWAIQNLRKIKFYVDAHASNDLRGNEVSKEAWILKLNEILDFAYENRNI